MQETSPCFPFFVPGRHPQPLEGEDASFPMERPGFRSTRLSSTTDSTFPTLCFVRPAEDSSRPLLSALVFDADSVFFLFEVFLI